MAALGQDVKLLAVGSDSDEQNIFLRDSWYRRAVGKAVADLLEVRAPSDVAGGNRSCTSDSSKVLGSKWG